MVRHLLAALILSAAPAAAQDYLHQPSTPRERALTDQLNREAAYADNGAYDDYQQALAQYRSDRARYDRQMQAYEDAMSGPVYGERDDWRDERPYPRALTGREEDANPYAPSGGAADQNYAAPTPGMSNRVTGNTGFNDRMSGRDSDDW